MNVSQDTASEPLPSFESPPLVEVVLGTQFAPLESLRTPHYGDFWQAIREDYPALEDHPPLPPNIERFGTSSAPTIEFTNIPPIRRSWFVSADRTSIIQLQRDRFLHNWRRVQDSDTYPRYDQVLESFLAKMELFTKFVAENDLGELNHNQFELTYVNRIPQGDAWGSNSEIGRIFPDFGWRSPNNRFLPEPETVNWNTKFLLPENTGRLHISLRTVTLPNGGSSLFLEMNARGFPPKTNKSEMRLWFDQAHRWIVLAFTDLTDNEVRKHVWRQQ
nr:TIGR04255 family protein [Rhodopirellula sp. SM50]